MMIGSTARRTARMCGRHMHDSEVGLHPSLPRADGLPGLGGWPSALLCAKYMSPLAWLVSVARWKLPARPHDATEDPRLDLFAA